MIDSIIDWYTLLLNDSTVLTVLGTIVAIIVLISLARAFLKIFVGLLVLGAIFIIAMYFLEGEEATENLIKDATEKVVSEAIDQTN
jgi:prepilin signal peptidase PulO-like enzyme (type II secretory pathway)